MEEPESNCFAPGSIAGAVIGTFLVTSVLIVIGYLVYKHWRRNKGKHLVLVTDPEIVDEAYAFDNPCFKDCTPTVARTHDGNAIINMQNESSKDGGNRWSTPWSHIGKHDKRRTLDDSCLGPKATKVSVVALRSRDFTGLGFNVCGNMREGIFVKDLLHRGPASESGRIHPGDRISSVKISFRSMVYEDALTILSYASPYDVELEVESGGGTGSRPASLLKRSVGPSPARICHPLYRSQSIPELGQRHSDGRGKPKRLFAADPNDCYSNHSTIKSSKSTPGVQTLERRSHEEPRSNHQPKFGIKVLPALDATAHRVLDQNEHNTNLERRHSRRLEEKTRTTESVQQRASAPPSGKKIIRPPEGLDVPDRAPHLVKEEVDKPASPVIPTEVPAEVHNAGMAARRNRKSSNSEQKPIDAPVVQETIEPTETKSPAKGKRKAPAPPSRSASVEAGGDDIPTQDDKPVNGIGDSKDPELTADELVLEKIELKKEVDEPGRNKEKRSRKNSESSTEAELPSNVNKIELDSADITIHHTPVPEESTEPEEDGYRKAASLGDLSKYENRSTTTLERAQSLDMTDPGSKKRKAPLPPPEDIHESTEDLTKLDQMDRRKLKKSNEWGTLEDAIWSGEESRKPSTGTLERSSSNVETKPRKEDTLTDRLNVSDGAIETSIELYNLPLSKKLTQDFIRSERLFDIEHDNALSRLVNDGEVVKSPSDEQVEIEFRESHPPPEDDPIDESFERAVRYFDSEMPKEEDLYAGKKEVTEPPMSKVTLNLGCPGCDHRGGHHTCANEPPSDSVTLTPYQRPIKLDKPYETHFAKPVVSSRSDDEDEYEFGSEADKRNVSNVSVSSGENSEDSGLAPSGLPQTMTYITEIKVSPVKRDEEPETEEIVSIVEKSLTSNGKLPAGKKPPVPPRRTDVRPDKQVVYVSEYKSPGTGGGGGGGGNGNGGDSSGNKFENWIFLKDAEKPQEHWGNGSSQPVTSIVLSSSVDETIARK